MRHILIASLAALGALSACRSKKSPTGVQKVASLADSADQVMFKLRTILTDRGVQRAELLADTGYFFDENTRAEMRVVSTTFFNSQGARDGTLTSKRGTYNTRASVMEARDNVVIVGVDGKRLTSPMVRFEQFRNIIVSDSPFVLVDGERRLEGVGFESDPQMLNVKVRQLSRGTGMSLILPSSRTAAPVIRNDSTTPPPPAAQPMTGPVTMPARPRAAPASVVPPPDAVKPAVSRPDTAKPDVVKP